MIRSILSLVVLAGLMGCGGETAKELPKTQPVSGVVTLDGQPLAGAVVTFIPTDATTGVECVGQTDESGKYSPTQTRGSEGVPTGTYKVTISRFLRGGKPIPLDDAGGGTGGVVVESLPPHYSNPSATTQTATVPEGGGTAFDFKLTSK
ncbi:MAG: carboxypeptidase regulatory-like domain-containing protein [Planctomycetaceae bacterium]